MGQWGLSFQRRWGADRWPVGDCRNRHLYGSRRKTWPVANGIVTAALRSHASLTALKEREAYLERDIRKVSLSRKSVSAIESDLQTPSVPFENNLQT